MSQSSSEAVKLFEAEGYVAGLELESAELARLRGVAGRFEKPREGSLVHLEAVEGQCVANTFTVDAAGRLFIKTEVPCN